MALGHGASIVRDGLVLHLDAASVKSYPGSGTTWSDLSGNDNNFTLFNGVGYSNNDNGQLTFDNTNDYGYITNSNNLDFTDNFSIEVFFKLSSVDSLGEFIQSNGNSIRLQHSNTLYFGTKGPAGRSDWGFGPTLETNVWYHYAITYENSLAKAYIDGDYYANRTMITPTSRDIWIVGGTNYWLDGSLTSIKVYNRVLSAAEIQQNFEALRGRYGI